MGQCVSLAYESHRVSTLAPIVLAGWQEGSAIDNGTCSRFVYKWFETHVPVQKVQVCVYASLIIKLVFLSYLFPCTPTHDCYCYYCCRGLCIPCFEETPRNKTWPMPVMEEGK
jgi:hypothetical protein